MAASAGPRSRCPSGLHFCDLAPPAACAHSRFGPERPAPVALGAQGATGSPAGDRSARGSGCRGVRRPALACKPVRRRPPHALRGRARLPASRVVPGMVDPSGVAAGAACGLGAAARPELGRDVRDAAFVLEPSEDRGQAQPVAAFEVLGDPGRYRDALGSPALHSAYARMPCTLICLGEQIQFSHPWHGASAEQVADGVELLQGLREALTR